MSDTAFIICGALGHEVSAIIDRYSWDVDVFGVSAENHVFTAKIGPGVEKRILELRAKYERLLVVYGDCGSQGVLDQVLSKYDIPRLEGAHCYEWYADGKFEAYMQAQLGTYFLTDFLVRGFEGTVKKSMGLDKYPELRAEYFRNYKQLVYLAQEPTEALIHKAEEISTYLELPLEVIQTGYGLLEKQLVAFMVGD